MSDIIQSRFKDNYLINKCELGKVKLMGYNLP